MGANITKLLHMPQSNLCERRGVVPRLWKRHQIS